MAVLAVAAVAAPASHASQIVDRNASNVRLRVDAAGRALLGYESGGRRRLVLASGAVDARPPTSGAPQVRFTLDYAARRLGRRALSGAFRHGCGTYDGPALVWLIAACKAPDGSYWAVQSWQRLQPMRGFAPWRPEQTAVELHLSHWTGALPVLEASPNWTYGGAWQGVFGRLTYRGTAVYGPSRARSYRRYLYIDVLDSAYGPGWKRDTAVSTHQGNGGFCYSFVPQAPPPGYPSAAPRAAGKAARQRVTVIGPGVTPIVQWEGAGLGRYDPVRDQAFNSVFDRILAGDRVCSRER